MLTKNNMGYYPKKILMLFKFIASSMHLLARSGAWPHYTVFVCRVLDHLDEDKLGPAKLSALPFAHPSASLDP